MKKILYFVLFFSLLFHISGFCLSFSDLGPYTGPMDTKDYTLDSINLEYKINLGKEKIFYRPLDNGTPISYIWPTNSRKITQTYNYPYHKGIDIAYIEYNNDHVYSIKQGYVVYSQWSRYGGNGIWINHFINGKYVQTRYYHLAEGSTTINNYEWVSDSQLIGLKGTTAEVPVPCHLHFEMREANSYYEISDNQMPIDPLNTYYTNPPWFWYQ